MKRLRFLLTFVLAALFVAFAWHLPAKANGAAGPPAASPQTPAAMPQLDVTHAFVAAVAAWVGNYIRQRGYTLSILGPPASPSVQGEVRSAFPMAGGCGSTRPVIQMLSDGSVLVRCASPPPQPTPPVQAPAPAAAQTSPQRTAQPIDEASPPPATQAPQ